MGEDKKIESARYMEMLQDKHREVVVLLADLNDIAKRIDSLRNSLYDIDNGLIDRINKG